MPVRWLEEEATALGLRDRLTLAARIPLPDLTSKPTEPLLCRMAATRTFRPLPRQVLSAAPPHLTLPTARTPRTATCLGSPLARLLDRSTSPTLRLASLSTSKAHRPLKSRLLASPA